MSQGSLSLWPLRDAATPDVPSGWWQNSHECAMQAPSSTKLQSETLVCLSLPGTNWVNYKTLVSVGFSLSMKKKCLLYIGLDTEINFE